jgi:hypothetical protein
LDYIRRSSFSEPQLIARVYTYGVGGVALQASGVDGAELEVVRHTGKEPRLVKVVVGWMALEFQLKGPLAERLM